MQYKKIGFIGQGFVGGNLSDNYEERGYKDIMVRYSHEKEYVGNKAAIRECDLVFVAVPTPSTPKGFDSSILYDVIPLTAPGTVVVLKSTMPPEIVRELQLFFNDRIIMLCPEFLTEATAKYDTDHPERNIIGVSNAKVPELVEMAEAVLSTLPKAPYKRVCGYEEASLVKYGGNCFFYVKNMFFNLLYDLAIKYDADWDLIEEMITKDSRINPVHTKPIHKSGRGAGGHCLIKDFATMRDMVCNKMEGDNVAKAIMASNELRNLQLLIGTKKDLDLVKGVYGKKMKYSKLNKLIKFLKVTWR